MLYSSIFPIHPCHNFFIYARTKCLVVKTTFKFRCSFLILKFPVYIKDILRIYQGISINHMAKSSLPQSQLIKQYSFVNTNDADLFKK